MNKKSFWDKLQKPIMALAPMADVTDVSFRQVISKYGKPDVFWTEFVACDGLCSVGQEKLVKNLLQFSEKERPIVAQLFGSNPENFEKSARLIKKLGFDGIDINMGCPQKNILKQGAGAELIKSPKLAKEIIRATKKGAGGLPVSVKTRIGYNKNEIETWIPAILEEEPVVLTIHGRTKKEMSKVSAHWDIIKDVVEIRDRMKSKTLVIGNGDIFSFEDGLEKAKTSGVDGIMIGRGIFGNPWFFSGKNPTIKEKIKVALEHTKLFEKIFGETKENKKIFGGRARNFALMKKHYKAYINGFDGAKELRIKLMDADSLKEVEHIISQKIKTLEK
ncbi:MAG: tRNA-dihydrouridine synthase [Candidatus Pacebacteria bacterium]|nr:tRNA-dihydrouridine synthase [Candidatus Paceibacterota bacterium]